MSWDDFIKIGVNLGSTIIGGGTVTAIIAAIVLVVIIGLGIWLKNWRNEQIEAANIKKREERQASNITENQELENGWEAGADRIEEKRKALNAGKEKKKRE